MASLIQNEIPGGPAPYLLLYGTAFDDSEAKFGDFSLKFDGSRQDVAQLYGGGQRFSYNNEAFTLEAWVYVPNPISSNTKTFFGLVGGLNNGVKAELSSGGRLAFYVDNTPVSTDSSFNTITASTWHHVAITLDGSTYRIFLNGKMCASRSRSFTWGSEPVLYLGAGPSYTNSLPLVFSGTSYITMNLDAVRYTKGVARYIADFTVDDNPWPTNAVDDPEWENVTVLFNFENGSADELPARAVDPLGEPSRLLVGSPLPQELKGHLHHDALRAIRQSISGGGKIVSTVKVDGSPDYPTRRQVILIRESDFMVVGSTWSDKATGVYSFNYLDLAEKYTVIAFDYEHNYRAVIADNLSPEPM